MRLVQTAKADKQPTSTLVNSRHVMVLPGPWASSIHAARMIVPFNAVVCVLWFVSEHAAPPKRNFIFKPSTASAQPAELLTTAFLAWCHHAQLENSMLSAIRSYQCTAEQFAVHTKAMPLQAAL